MTQRARQPSSNYIGTGSWFNMMERSAYSRYPKSAFLAVILAIAGCSNPSDYQVSKLTRDQQLVLGEALTADQMRDLDNWIKRHTVPGEALPTGVTVDDALKDQADWTAKQRAQKEQLAALQKKRQAEHEAKQAAFAKLVSVALLSKTNHFQPDDRRFVSFELEYSNKSDKEIKAIHGVMIFGDVYGEPVIEIDWSYNEGIPPKQTIVERPARFYVDESIPSQAAFWGTDFNKLKFKFEVKSIMFKDGTSTAES